MEVRPNDPSHPTQQFVARQRVVVATGSSAAIPEVLREVQPWTNREVTSVQDVPERLLIVGGGVVACEAATWMQAHGCDVTMLVRGDALLHGQEPFAGEFVLSSLRNQGVTVVFGADVTVASRTDAGVTLTTSRGTFTATEVLAVTGRQRATEALGGYDPATTEWLDTVGDVRGRWFLTYLGKYEARVLGSAIVGSDEYVPEDVPEDVPAAQVVFTMPQVARVGQTLADAQRAGVDVVTTAVPFNAAAGTALVRDTVAGQAQLVVDRSTGLLLGATFVGPDAAELIHAATVAIVGRVPVAVLRHAVPAYPTASELWLRLLEQLPRELRRHVSRPGVQET